MTRNDENQHKQPTRHVALAFPTGLSYLQPLVRGITDYARRHGRWVFMTTPEAVTLPIARLRGWRGDGVIAALLTPADRRVATTLGLPVVSVSGALKEPGVPRVTNHNGRVGELAAEHLIACGFSRLAFYGLKGVSYARQRYAGFAESARVAGRPVSAHFSRNAIGSKRPLADEMQKLDEWLATLQRPIGIFAANDMRARMVLDGCARLDIRVPEEVGVIGVDDDVVTCEFSEPPLSSIKCDWHRVGTEAAERLDRLMRGVDVPAEDLRIDPIGVVRRASTDTLIVEHPAVAQVVWHIREHPTEQFNVKTLLRHADVSRRALELAFRKELGCTPHEYVTRERVGRAKILMTHEPNRKLMSVARECGFADVRRFRIVFERHEGVTPSVFRRCLRKGDVSPRKGAAAHRPAV